jgi:hypothetical protein
MSAAQDIMELGERIAIAAAHVDAAMHRLLADIREFDAKDGWWKAGAISCATWLSWRVGWDLGTARDRVRVARALGTLPQIDDALRRGELSYSKCRALCRVATADNEAQLLAYARCSTAAQLEKILRKYQRVLSLAGAAQDGAAPPRRMGTRLMDSGMVKVEVVLTADEAELVMATARAAAKRVSAETLNLADGLMDVVRAAASGGSPTRTPVEVVVTVPKAGLVADNTAEVGELPDGTPVSAETARYLSCDCGVVEVTETDDGRVLSVGRKTRTIPASLKRALLRRDRTCRYPGCTNTAWVHGHHVQHWANGGETALGNLVTLCPGHHRIVHDRGIRIELGDGAEPRFYNRRGVLIPPIPPRPWLRDPGLTTITAANANANVAIDAATNACHWDGTRVQYASAVDALCVRDSRLDAARAG